MTPAPRNIKPGFRGRLALSIAVTTTALGAALVTVQYFSLIKSFEAEIVLGTNGAVVDASGTVSDCEAAPAGVACQSGGKDDPLAAYGSTLAQDVLGRYLSWSIALLAVFAIVAALLAWFLSRSPARKIAHISTLAAEITEKDLSRRLHIPGPADEITELGEQINTMLERLQDAFSSQDRFVGNASHELRTPTTTIRAALEAPLSQGLVPQELQPYLQRVLRANHRMDELITALLLLARARHLYAEDFVDVNLKELVTTTLEEISERAVLAKLTVTVDIPPGATLHGHRASLAIAVRNLLSNAVQHNVQGGRISVVFTDQADVSALTVANTGSHYSNEETAALSQPFNRGLHTRQTRTAGTGLGLSIVDSIATAHSGTLDIRPGEESGLTVKLSIPNQ